MLKILNIRLEFFYFFYFNSSYGNCTFSMQVVYSSSVKCSIKIDRYSPRSPWKTNRFYTKFYLEQSQRWQRKSATRSQISSRFPLESERAITSSHVGTWVIVTFPSASWYVILANPRIDNRRRWRNYGHGHETFCGPGHLENTIIQFQITGCARLLV